MPQRSDAIVLYACIYGAYGSIEMKKIRREVSAHAMVAYTMLELVRQ
jgi:hypothetical protein